MRTFAKILILVVLVLSSCKKQETTMSTSPAPPMPPPAAPPPPVDISSTTQFLNRFVSLATAHGITVDASKTHIGYNTSAYVTTSINGTITLGVCSRAYTGDGTIAINDIVINQAYWEAWYRNGRKSDMEQLLFHELAHCLLNRGHNNAMVAATDYASQIPVTIMNAHHLDTNEYESNYPYYIDELYIVPATSSINNPPTTVAYNPITVGSVPLYVSGTSGFNGGVYASIMAPIMASSEIVKVETFTMRADDISPEFDPDKPISDFYCDDDDIIIH